MEFMKEQSIKLHREMWNWIADEIERRKSVLDIKAMKGQYAFKNSKRYVLCNCFLCDYTKIICEKCPLEWKSDLKEFMCSDMTKRNDNKGIYELCKRSENWEEQARLAREIANLKEREVV